MVARGRRISIIALLATFLLAKGAPALAADRGKIDVDVVNGDLRNVLRLFADVGHVNLVLGDDVSGTVTLWLKNVPWEAAMRATLSVKGLQMERTGNIVRVQAAEAFARERASRLSAHELCLATAPVETRIVRIDYADAEQVAAIVRPTLTKRGSVSVDTRTNTLIIRDVRCD